MVKYEPLWQYIANCGQEEMSLSFHEIEMILGTAVNHGFLNSKKELEAYGYRVKKISLKAQRMLLERMNA